MALVILGTALLFAAHGSGRPAGVWSLAGQTAIEWRYFSRPPLFDDQEKPSLSPSLRFASEIRYEWNHGLDRFTLLPFLRLDRHDSNRTHFDLRELSWIHQANRWSLLAGMGKVFWGVAESRHLVDTINQTDLVEDLDGEDKLGQPMINVTIESSWGAVDLFLLPLFRERTFPSHDARLRSPVAISGTPGFFSANGDPSYESDLEEWHPDTALRYSHSAGEVDIGVAHFHGTSREPRFLVDNRAGGLSIRPRYDIIDQSSLDVQWTHGAWLWKLESIGRWGHGDAFLAAVVGLERTLYQVAGTTADLGLLVEYSYDGRSDDPGVAPPTDLDDDLFVGFRFAWNNVQGTQLLGGTILDLNSGETFALLEAGHRLGDRHLLDLEARWFVSTDPGGLASALRRDGFVTLRFSRFF